MSSLTRRLLVGFLVTATLSLGACSNESQERTVFMQFLQTCIVDQKGLRLPQLKEEERKRFGDHAAHYDVMSGFTATWMKPCSRR
ncbi:MAG: DUF3053 family protein [Pseudomonadota bacterium]